MNAAGLFSHWKQVRQGLYDALDLLTDEQLAFVPAEGLWPLGTVACHIANAEDGWFRYIAAGELDDWPSMEPERYTTVASIKALLEEVHDYTLAYLEGLDVADLERQVTTFWGAELTVRWIIWHVLEHEISHRGEIYLMLGMMGIEAPDV